MKDFAVPKVKEEVSYWQKKSEELKNELRQEAMKRTDAEKSLSECYEYLGVVNRQLAVLLNLGKDGNGKKGKSITNFILESALNLSGAKFAAFYNYNESGGELHLVASVGIEESSIAKNFIGLDCETLRPLFTEKVRVHGKIKNKELEKAGLNSKAKFFLALPIVANEKIIEVLFLGFDNKESVTTQELDFYEVFSMQASFLISSSRCV